MQNDSISDSSKRTLRPESISMSQSICPSARLNAAENDEIQCREMRSYLTRVFCSPITFNYLNVGRLVLLLLLLLQGITDGQQKKDD